MADASEIWTGQASDYDRARPAPPQAVLDVLTQYINQPRPTLVVDLGSGTGLSSMVWAGRAQQVIGIEPNADMRAQATRKAEGLSPATQITYRAGVAHATGLPDGCADIVTAAQSFHWMEPAPTLAEVARILRPGGLFAAYDYDWPPTIRWEFDLLAQEASARLVALVRERGLPPTFKIWPKDKHLEHMRESGHFRLTHEVLLHHVEHGDAARFLAMARSNAFSRQFQFSDEEIGLDRLGEAARQYIGAEPISWYVSYRVRIAVK